MREGEWRGKNSKNYVRNVKDVQFIFAFCVSVFWREGERERIRVNSRKVRGRGREPALEMDLEPDLV